MKYCVRIVFYLIQGRELILTKRVFAIFADIISRSIRLIGMRGKKQLLKIAEDARRKNAQYDCVVGVSGGKDSTYMALFARDELGLRVLLANMAPDKITEIGKHNLNNLQEMGFDCFMFRPKPKGMQKTGKNGIL